MFSKVNYQSFELPFKMTEIEPEVGFHFLELAFLAYNA